MRRATIAYRDGELEAREQGDRWTVRLANLETRARYLDLALAELLGNAPEAHRAAARLLSQLADVVEEQQARAPHRPANTERRERTARRRSAQPVRLGLRILLLATVSSAAFMLTTWLATLR